MTTQTAQQTFTWTQFFVRFVVMFLLLAAALFLPAGTLAWGGAWAYLIIVVGLTVYGRIVVMRENRALIEERVHSLEKEDTKSWDKILVPLIAVFVPVVMLATAGLDQRYGWTAAGSIPLWAQVIAALAIAFGVQISNRAVIVNAFFSGTVRIQKERNHHVVTDGPYRFVRHPAYLGGIIANFATPFLLTSLWALIPAGILIVLTILRTALEDRTLQAELPGYATYAQAVRFRLIPGIW
jgi:protein-S-isoprenylcysteine O-methyltransferase Ste14